MTVALSSYRISTTIQRVLPLLEAVQVFVTICGFSHRKVLPYRDAHHAAELAAKYRAQYPRRTAMFDELKKF